MFRILVGNRTHLDDVLKDYKFVKNIFDYIKTDSLFTPKKDNVYFLYTKEMNLSTKELKEFDKDWEYRRTNIDGTEALIHEEIFNEYFPPVMLLSETDEDTTAEYPFPLLDEEDITNSPEWSDPEQEII